MKNQCRRHHLEDERLSFKAKGILGYLLSKPDNWKVIVGDLVKRSTDGKASVYSGLNELKKYGYYAKRPVRNDKGIIVRWESTVYESPVDPLAGKQEVDKTLANTAPYPLTDYQEMGNPEMDKPNIDNREHNNNYINNNYTTFIKERESKSPPALTEKVYGEFTQVRMSDSDHAKLIEKHGKEKTEDYIAQLDEAFASGRVQHRPKENHRAIIEGWIRRDSKQPPREPHSTPVRRRFNNFKGRQRDYAELERLEREYLRERVAAMAPNDGEPGPRATP